MEDEDYDEIPLDELYNEPEVKHRQYIEPDFEVIRGSNGNIELFIDSQSIHIDKRLSKIMKTLKFDKSRIIKDIIKSTKITHTVIWKFLEEGIRLELILYRKYKTKKVGRKPSTYRLNPARKRMITEIISKN